MGFVRCVAEIAEPYATMLYTAAYTGLQPSERVELRRRNVGDDWIRVEERCCRGDWGAPKREASNATLDVNTAVVARIRRSGRANDRGARGTGHPPLSGGDDAGYRGGA